jgi:hypothetical protein
MLLMPHFDEDGDMNGVTCPLGIDAIGEVRAKKGNNNTIILTSNWADCIVQKKLQDLCLRV